MSIGPLEMIIIVCIIGFFVFVAIVILAAVLMRPRTTGGTGEGTGLDMNNLKNGDAAGGDLAGTYPYPEVVRLRGMPVSFTPPADGQVLVWNQSAGQWEPRDLPGSTP
ncbi:MAG: hypothetical protein ACWGO1_14060 [Anaerolineales bacterium]